MSALSDPHRVSLWVNSPSNLGRMPQIATAAGASFTDVHLPRVATPDDVRKVHAQTRALDGQPFGAHLFEIAFQSDTIRERPNAAAAVGRHPESGYEVDLDEGRARKLAKEHSDVRLRHTVKGLVGGFVQQVHGDIARFSNAGTPIGTVELDIEVSDAVLGQFIRQTIQQLRILRSTFLFRINLAPHKAGYLPADLLQSDPYLFASQQCYFGDMSRVGEAQLLQELWQVCPPQKASLCYGAAAQSTVRDANGDVLWKRVGNVPSVFYQAHAVSKIPGPALVFSDDLYADTYGL